jgi:hypothetical protein
MLDSAHRIAQYIIKCPPKEKDRVKIKASKQSQKAKEDEELVKKAQALKIKDSADWTDGNDHAQEGIFSPSLFFCFFHM